MRAPDKQSAHESNVIGAFWFGAFAVWVALWLYISATGTAVPMGAQLVAGIVVGGLLAAFVGASSDG